MKPLRFLVPAALAAALAGCGENAPEMTAQQLMAERVQPTAEVYWDAVQWISDTPGEEARLIQPQSDADWEKVVEAAIELQELGKLLQTPGYTEGRSEEWGTFAQALVEVSQKAEQAARSKDVDEVFAVGGTVYSVCSACHEVFPPAEGLPDGA